MHLLHVYLLETDHVFVSSLFRFARDVWFAYLVFACESRSEIVKINCNPLDASLFDSTAGNDVVFLSLATQNGIQLDPLTTSSLEASSGKS